MNRISRLFDAGKSAAAVGGGDEGEGKESRRIGRSAHRETSAVAVSLPLVATGEHSSRKKGSGRQGGLSSGIASRAEAAPCAEAVKLIFASSAQQSAEVSAGARPKQWPQPEPRKTGSKMAPALAPSSTRKAGGIEQAMILRRLRLPRSLLEKGYRMTGTELFARDTVQLAYSLTKDVSDGSGNSDFVVKYPCDADRIKALKGLKIREELARLKEADKYFVPVVEQVIKNGQLICYVEPEGVPVIRHIENKGLKLTQKLPVFLRILTAVKIMHTQEIVHLDIKPDNLIMKNPAIDMTIRFCNFDSAVHLSPADMNEPNVVQPGTCEYACSEVLQGTTSCLHVMADLWSFTLTVWSLMASEVPCRHWLSGMMNDTEERRSKILSELFGVAFSPARNQTSEWELLPFNAIPAFIKQMITCLDKQSADDVRKQLQLLFWDNLKFPADIDRLQLSAAEKCILKEMLSIMFFSFGYGDTLESMERLIIAALRCADTLETYFEHDETKALETIINAGYQPCNHAIDTKLNRSRILPSYLSGHSSDDELYEEISTVAVDPGDTRDG